MFTPSEDSGKALILLDAIKGRYEFPELRRIALEQYGYWNPETVIIESKASGLPLTYELRKAGIPVITSHPQKVMINIRGLTVSLRCLSQGEYGRPKIWSSHRK